MKNAWVSGPAGRVQHYDTYASATKTYADADPKRASAAPDTSHSGAAPGFIETGAAGRVFRNAATCSILIRFLMLPAVFAAMVLIAASFSLRLARLGGLGRVVVWGALAGFGLYFLSALTHALGETGIRRCLSRRPRPPRRLSFLE